jgi:purine-nucleoside/S-methyl-5'-thioadenosine phosphorylase / adenosine deaminase
MSPRPIALSADWPAPPGIQAWVSTRHGGVSQGAYASLNLATHVGDDPQAVAENRRRLSAALALPAEPHWLEQVHGSAVVDLDLDPRTTTIADAAVTRRVGVVGAVLTADCLPVVLADRAGTGVGIAHGGWRGLAGGVLEATLHALGAASGQVLAWLGPAIGAADYEVGPEVRAAFLARGAVPAGAFTQNARGRWQADLYALARAELNGLGVTQVYGGMHSTYAEPRQFFSHRRGAPCGRMVTLVWRDT